MANSMDETIYVELFDEGTPVWRPVSASKIDNNIYVLGGQDTYNPDDEHWQFLPGSRVLVEQRKLSKGRVLVAIQALDGVAYIGDQGIHNSELVEYQQQGNQVTVILKSCGYRRKRNSLFKLVFHNVTALSEHAPNGQILYGLCELVKPRQKRQFCIMVTHIDSCMDIIADSATIEEWEQS